MQIAYFPACYCGLDCSVCLSAAPTVVLVWDLAGLPAAATQASSNGPQRLLHQYHREQKWDLLVARVSTEALEAG